ncbi:MAG: hypothetical protein WCP57_11150 [Bacteroidota bacterium]
MAKLKVQLNHPGNQKPFKLGEGYSLWNEKIYREWNCGNHFRKFIYNDGLYISKIGDTEPKKSDLYFWGEWEGNSFYEPLKNNDYRRFPNGIHKPFHSKPKNGTQNTDPYIYGEYFKYATCKQTGALYNLSEDSLILFGSTYPSLGKFYIDTIFVVKSFETAVDICSNSAQNYTNTYKEQTLEQLNSEYLGPKPSTKKRLYHGKTWYENLNYFSYVPSKLTSNKSGFERFYIDLNNPILKLSKNATGKSFLPNCHLSPEEVWNLITIEVLTQGFVLGIKFYEPDLFDMQSNNLTLQEKF